MQIDEDMLTIYIRKNEYYNGIIDFSCFTERIIRVIYANKFCSTSQRKRKNYE